MCTKLLYDYHKLVLAYSPTLPSIEECSDVQCIALRPKKKQNLIVIEI